MSNKQQQPHDYFVRYSDSEGQGECIFSCEAPLEAEDAAQVLEANTGATGLKIDEFREASFVDKLYVDLRSSFS